MGNKILQNLIGTINDIDVSPVDPRMLRLQGSSQEVVASFAHGLPTGTLCLETMAILNILAKLEAKVLLDHHGTPKGNLVRTLLNTVELSGEDSEGLIGRVADEEGKIDEVVRIGKLGKELKVFREMRSSVLEGSEEEDSFFVLDSLHGGLDRVQINVGDSGLVDHEGSMAVEGYWGLLVSGPCCLFVKGHLHGRFRWAKTIETVGNR